MNHTPRRHRLKHRGRPIDAWSAGDGPPIVLIHGWGLSGRVFRTALTALAKSGYRAIAPSAAVLDTEWTLDGAAQLVAETMAALGADRAPVVGHSLGGCVAVRVASHYPESCSALVAIDSPLIGIGAGRMARIVLPGRHYRIAGHGSTTASLLGSVARRGGIGAVAAAARWVVREHLEEQLAIIRDRSLPSAIMWAEDDSLLPLEIGERAAAILRSKIIVVRATDEGWCHKRPPDHDWPMRCPRFFARRVPEVLAGIGAGPPTASSDS